MSRIGRLPITVPEGVNVHLEGSGVTIQGPRGKLFREFRPEVAVSLSDNILVVTRKDDAQQSRAFHGLTRALLANMVVGVTEGFRKRLVINGVGYRAEQQGEDIVLQIGFSHPVRISPLEGITLTVERGGHSLVVVVEGNDKEVVGEMAARIRAVRKPEPYKGKGIAYDGEVIRRKAGKAGRVGGAV